MFFLQHVQDQNIPCAGHFNGRQSLLAFTKMLSNEQKWNSRISILNEHLLFSELAWNGLLFSELAWNISELSKGLLTYCAHFFSELRWNSQYVGRTSSHIKEMVLSELKHDLGAEVIFLIWWSHHSEGTRNVTNELPPLHRNEHQGTSKENETWLCNILLSKMPTCFQRTNWHSL